MKTTIQGIVWTVEYRDKDNEKLQLDGEPCFGVTNYEENKIYIRAGMQEEMERRTVVHELVHAYAFSRAVAFAARENEIEERVCEFVAAYQRQIAEDAEKIIKVAHTIGGGI